MKSSTVIAITAVDGILWVLLALVAYVRYSQGWYHLGPDRYLNGVIICVLLLPGFGLAAIIKQSTWLANDNVRPAMVLSIISLVIALVYTFGAVTGAIDMASLERLFT